MLGPFSDLINYAVGIGAAALLGATKKYTGWADTKIGGFIKPVQPILVAVLAAVGSGVLSKLGVDAATAVSAPTAAVVGIAAREVLSRLKGLFG